MGENAGESLLSYFKKNLHKLNSDSDSMFCQNPRCSQGEAATAVKVCHNCASRPLLLCAACDKKAHSELRFKGHMRFDLPSSTRPPAAAPSHGQHSAHGPGGGGIVPAHSRSMSLPDRRTSMPYDHPAATRLNHAGSHSKFPSAEEDLDSEERDDLDLDDNVLYDTPDGRYRRLPGRGFVYMADWDERPAAAEVPEGASYKRLTQEAPPPLHWVLATAEILNQPFKGDYFTVHLYTGKSLQQHETIQVSAVRGQKIRPAIDQLLESRQLSFEQVDVYLGSCTLGLTGIGDTFFLGGMTVRIYAGDSKELARRSSNGSLQPGPSDKTPQGRVDDVRGSSDSAFRKSSSASMLKSTSASSALGTGSRSSYAGFRRGVNQRDSKQMDPSSGISKLLHLSEDYQGRHSEGRHSEDSGSETASSGAGASASNGRLVRKAVSSVGFAAGGSSSTSLTAPAEEPHQDVSPSGTISKAWRGNNALAAASAYSGRFSSLLPLPYKEKEKAERLAARLDEWSKNGIPEMPRLLTMSLPQYDLRVLDMEERWTVFVEHEILNSKQKDQQEALWELFYTEVEYIKSLNVVRDLFMSCLYNLQNEQLLNDIAVEQLFANVTEIVQINLEFWQTQMLPALNFARQSRTLLNPRLLKTAFHRFSERFHPYTKYCLEQSVCSEYMKKMDKENELFRTFVVWAEAQKQCNRLKLHDLLVKPMQRLTRYSLLLNAIAKKTDDLDAKQDLTEMIGNVDTFVKAVDQTLRLKHEEEKLLIVAGRIELYDVVDMPYSDAEASKLLAAYSAFDIRAPMPECGSQLRHLMLEGSLKMKEANGGKSDVTLFLFTDLLLVTKAKRADKVKITKPPMRVDRCIVEELGKDSNAHFLLIHLSEYGVAQAAYAFHGENITKWVNTIRKAKGLYARAKEEALKPASAIGLQTQLSTAVLGAEDEEMGYAGPDLQRVASNGSSGEETSGAAAAASPEEQLQQKQASLDGGHDAAEAPFDEEAQEALCCGGGSNEEDDEEENRMAMAAAALPVSYSDRGASGLTKASTLPCVYKGQAVGSSFADAADMATDDKASHRRRAGKERRFHTADAIQAMSTEMSLERGVQSRRSWNPAGMGDLTMNGEDRWELDVGLPPFRGNGSMLGGHRDDDSGAVGGYYNPPPRAMPRRHVPAAATGEIMFFGEGAPSAVDHRYVTDEKAYAAAGVGGPGIRQAFPGASSQLQLPDEDTNGLAASGRQASSVHAGPRSNRKLSHAELLLMRKQMFINNAQDAAEV